LFRTYCSNCHGANKKGTGVGPDLTGRAKKYKNAQIASILQKGAPPMPSFKFLSQEQIAAIVAYVKDTVAQQSFETPDIPQNNEPYGFNGYSFYLDPEGDPAIAPPFGTMTAIDLNTGDIVWQVPLGEDPKFKKMGIANSGMFNRGGGIATAGGLIFIGATATTCSARLIRRQEKYCGNTSYRYGEFDSLHLRRWQQAIRRGVCEWRAGK
jgi:quinoprotein glucose dehydrogenase